MFGALLLAIVLGNESVRIEFDGESGGFGVRAIENLRAGGIRFVNPPADGSDLWRLDFTAPAGADGKLRAYSTRSRRSAAKTSYDCKGGKAVFRWEGMDVADERGVLDVEAEVRLSGPDGFAEWRLKVDNRSKVWALDTTHYPILRDVMKPGEGDFLQAAKPLGGQLHRNYRGASNADWLKFPTTAPPMCAYMIGEAGLYVGVHDPNRAIMRFVYGPQQSFEVATPVENAGVVGKAASGPRFCVTTGVFKGDWWRAAKIYRRWALRQKWAAKGPIARRADFPQSLKDLDVCAIVSTENAVAASNQIARLARLFDGLKLGIHWYRWHNSGFCVNFPEFFPARKGVREVMSAWTKAGVLMMPYTDPRNWDTHQASWEFAREHACLSNAGDYKTIDYLGNESAIMCPSSEKWRKSVWKWSRQVLDEAGANAIYYDQVAVARPFECYDARHGHPVGGGTWWTDGYRKMLEPMHELYSSRNAPITSELSGDTWLDLIDGYLLCGAPSDDEVPLCVAVYAGHAVYFGSEENACDPADTFESWQMRQFTWGILPGWFDRWDLSDPQFARQRTLVSRVAKIRRAAADYMIYGTLEDEVRFVDRPKDREYRMNYLWHPNLWPDKVHLPDLHGMVWKNLQGSSVAVFIASASDEERKSSFHVPVRGLKVRTLPETQGVKYEERGKIGTVILPPHGIAFLEAKCRN